MGIMRSLPDVEEWLSANSQSWTPLLEAEYKTLVQDWTARFGVQIEEKNPAFMGHRALDALAENLAGDVVFFSGLKVPEVGNLGGYGPCGYRATGIRHVDHALLRKNELLVCAPDYSWTCLFSHETGDWYHEQFYLRREFETG